MKKIFFVTKLKTTNLGNEGLSNELIKAFFSNVDDAIINVNGRPMGLTKFDPSVLLKSKDPLSQFEKWTDQIVNKIKKQKPINFAQKKSKVELTVINNSKKKWFFIKEILKSILDLFNISITYNKRYADRAGLLKSADWVIYNGAGEVNDGHHGNFEKAGVFFRQMIELRVSQKLGLKTAAINQSISLRNPLSQKIISKVYGKMEKIVVRGESSRQELIKMGINEKIIDIAPDFTVNIDFNQIASTTTKLKNKIGFNITKDVDFDLETLSRIFTHLKNKGKEIVFCTNEPSGDTSIIKLLDKEFGIPVIRSDYGYKYYIEELSKFEFVISMRVHTNMFTLVSNTPIIPLEAEDFRLAEILDILEYPIKPIKTKKSNWVDVLLDEIDNVIHDKYNMEKYFPEKFNKIRNTSIKNVSWINNY